MSSMTAIWRVAVREIRTRLLAKATIISTAIMLVLIVGVVIATGIITNSDSESTITLAVAEETAPLDESLQQAASAHDTSLEISDGVAADAGHDQVLEGDVDAYLSADRAQPEVAFDGEPDSSVMDLVSDAVETHALTTAVADTGGDSDQVQQAVAAAAAQPVDIGETSFDDLDPATIIVTFATTGLLLFSLIQAASLVAMGVVEEKSSRVVEILLATIRPFQLLAGKVVGVGVISLSQVVVFAGGALLAAQAMGLLAGVPVNIGAAAGALLLWFLLGFTVFVILVGGLAALVSRQEDIGAVTTPMIFGMMIPFYLGIYLVPASPSGMATKVLSQIPFFSPFMMPVRVAFDSAQPWEVALSVLLCLLAIPALIWLGGRVYGRAVLNTGGRMKLTAALRG